jgi:hypothetical protein
MLQKNSITNPRQWRNKVVSENLYYKQLEISRVFENTKQVSQIISISFEDYKVLKSGGKTKEFKPFSRCDRGDSPIPIIYRETNAFLLFYGVDIIGKKLLYYSKTMPVTSPNPYAGFILK